ACVVFSGRLTMKLQSLKRNYFVLLGLLTLFACERKNKDLFTAEGQVFDAVTGKHVPNATVEIRSEERAFCLFCFGYNWYDTVESEREADENGRFAFSYEGQEKIRYALGARSENYYFHKDSSYVKLEKGKNNRFLRLFVNPYAWVKYQLVNEGPKD